MTLRRYSGHNGRVECAVFGGEGDAVVISGSFDSTIRLWDARSQSIKPLMVMQEAKDSVTSLVVTGAEILAGSVDGQLRTYDLRMGSCYVDVVGREYMTTWLAWYKDAAETTCRICHVCDNDTSRRLSTCLVPRLDTSLVGQVEWETTPILQTRRLHQHHISYPIHTYCQR